MGSNVFPAQHEDSPPEHIVRFYESDQDLTGAVTDFLVRGLRADEPIFAIATQARTHALRERLRAASVDLEEAEKNGDVTILDADETLAKLMAGAVPVWERFRSEIGDALERLTARRNTRVRAYGEMVDILWRAGNRAAAVQLEGMWNDLQAKHRFTLYSAYVVDRFYKESDLRDVSASHPHVVPLLSRPAPQHADFQTRAMQAEIAHLREVERTLRKCLRDLEAANRMREQREIALLSSARRSQRLTRITAAIANAVTSEEVYEAIVDHVAAALGATSAAFWQLSEDGLTASLIRSLGFNQGTAQALQVIALQGTAQMPVLDALRGTAVWLDSKRELIERYPNVADLVTAKRNYSVAAIPVSVRDRTSAALSFTFEDGPPIDDEQRSLLLLVGRYAGQALERLELLEQERKSRAEAEAAALESWRLQVDNERARARTELLYDLARVVIGAENLGDIHRSALNAITSALGTPRAAISAFDREGGMRFEASRGLSDEYLRAMDGHSLYRPETPAPVPVHVSDVEHDSGYAIYLDVFRRENIRSLHFVPLVTGKRLLGKFMIFYDQPRELAPAEIEAAVAIANHVAAAMARFEAVSELKSSVRVNEMFAAILGHDLRNPLAAIITGAELIGALDESGKTERAVSRILSSGQRMARMIDQLLDFSRVRVGGQLPIDRRQIDLLPLLRHVVEELQGRAKESPPVLAFRGDFEGVWDPDRLSQVFSNLIANALHHGTGGVVHVDADGTTPDQVIVQVHNRGVIPFDLLPLLFEPMSMSSQRRARSQGLGLGLFITRQIARAHGGDVTVRSSESDGTTFSVSLPRQT